MLSVIHLIHLWETQKLSPFSGAENHLFVLLPALRSAGVRVELGVLLIQSGPAIESKIAELRAQGIEVNCFPYRPVIDLRCIGALHRHLASRRVHIVHTHLDYADVTGKIAARLAGCSRVVSTVHNTEPSHLRPKWFYLLRLLDHLTTRHIAISEAVRRHLVELERVAPGKVTVIPYGVHPPDMTSDRAALRAQLGIPDDRFVVGFVGRLVEQKNVSLLIAAMVQLPDALCLIIGDGALRSELEQLAADLSNVQFVGYQPQAEALMPVFDVLCLPSHWEGLGLVLVEAMLRRVPIVGSRAGAIPEVLDNGQYGILFEPNDLAGLVEALRSARALGATFVERAYECARQTYTVDKMVERTLTVYGELVTGVSI